MLNAKRLSFSDIILNLENFKYAWIISNGFHVYAYLFARFFWHYARGKLLYGTIVLLQAYRYSRTSDE